MSPLNASLGFRSPSPAISFTAIRVQMILDGVLVDLAGEESFSDIAYERNHIRFSDSNDPGSPSSYSVVLICGIFGTTSGICCPI